MGRPAARLYRALEGLFAVYKPPGVHWKLVRDTVETNLLRGLNGAPRPAPRSQVKFLPEPCRDNRVTLEASVLPVLADHPLVAGPQFQKLRVGVGHRLDVFSSGILGLHTRGGVWQSHRRFLLSRPCHRENHLRSCYQGQVGERPRHDPGRQSESPSHMPVCRYSNVDMRSQEAYELAAKGSLRPQSKSPPIITGLRCLKFAPPHFTLEVHCVNETQKYLRRLVHEIGLELRSSAVCTGVRRERDGPFKLQHALTRQHWTLPDITQAVHCSWATWTGGEVNTVQPEPHKPLTMG
ncbi:pseudouridylate synthase TRUB2, mitochondrial isoform X2 [Scleropages formosus]|uniref:pseudouridylate synthase TRUB2, mitochondrial isoform X2 n=1 Tax=Scleropages formosus TaxID=113540 RepID=UPI0010FA666A|nr:mitochondrial mRNA pseudouridine synthase TRUB2 isoform X2 [Scleropages formosus]